MAEKYLWENIRTVETLAQIATNMSDQAKALTQKELTEEDLPACQDLLKKLPVLLSTLVRRVDRQQNQIMELTQWLYQNIPENQMLKLLIHAGIDRSELVYCYNVDAGTALRAQWEAEKEVKQNGQ